MPPAGIFYESRKSPPMTTPWLHIIGIGEEGMAGLTPASRAVLEAAEVVIGGDRHHSLAPDLTAERIAWPSPFDALIDQLRALRGRRVVVLATGDPLWYSVGARIARAMDPAEITFHPQVSAFQHAAARLGWSMADSAQLTVHGRAVEQVIPFIAPNARLLILTTGSETPAQVADILVDRGYGASKVTVLAAMGGAHEARFDGTAEAWAHEVPAFNTMAVACIPTAGAAILPLTGLPDDCFVSDGTMTKQEVRAATMAKLMPMRGALLWDVGCGCGSVAVEWMRGARDALAIGVEPRADRRDLAARNAIVLGAPKLELRAGKVPEALADLPAPDAVFIGGGLSRETVEASLGALKPFGRLVANAVTIESESLLVQMQKTYGGELVKIAVSRAGQLGGASGPSGWRPSMAVTQWSLIKR